MPKLSIDQKIKQVQEKIEKEQKKIENSKAKIKAYQKDLKAFNEEKNKHYADDFLKILSENGLNSDEDKTEFMQMIKEQFKKPNE